MPKQPFDVIGHRGNGAGKNENTLASCRAAIRHGAKLIEVDVQLMDGELIAAHPPRRGTEKLNPLLSVINVPMILHLKRRHWNPWHDRRAIRQLVPAIGERSDISVSSVWPGTLTYLKRHHPNVRTVLNTWLPNYDLLFYRRLGVSEYSCWHYLTNARTVQMAKQRGLDLSVFVVPPHERCFRKFAALGIRKLMTDSVRYFAKPTATRKASSSRPASSR